MTYKEITGHFLNLADPKTARQSLRFFKTSEGEYAYGDKFLGVRVPVIRLAVKKYKAVSLTDVKRLLKSEYHEIRLFALLMLVAQYSCANNDQKNKIYDLYLSNTKYINNWDLVDGSAHHIVGAHLYDKDRSTLYHLSTSNSLWERRIAIIATYHYIKNNQFKDTLLVAMKLLNDQEDLIHKAVGWMLREVGNRDRAQEVKFLNQHYHNMPGTMLRYAIEKFSKTEREKYLSGTI